MVSKSSRITSQRLDVRRDADRASVNPITHFVFHDYQGKRDSPVHFSTDSHAREQPALRYNIPPLSDRQERRKELYQHPTLSEDRSRINTQISGSMRSIQQYHPKDSYHGESWSYV